MKKIIYYLAALIIVFIAFACEKDEERVIIKDNPNAPVLLNPATGTKLALTPADSLKKLIFAWKEADYGFNASVAYMLLADAENGKFIKPQKLLKSNLFNDTALVLYKDLNTFALKINPTKGTEGIIKVRLVSILLKDTLKAEEINLNVTTY